MIIIMSRRIKVIDKVGANERHFGGFFGEVIFGRGRHDVTFRDPYGKLCVRSEFDEVLYKDHNIVPIGGYQFAFDKLFNIGLDQEKALLLCSRKHRTNDLKI